MLTSTTGTRGRPRGSSKKKISSTEEYEKLTEMEKFEVLKNQLYKDLKEADIDPKPLKDIIVHRMDAFNIRSEKRGSQLWAKTLIQRGKYREEAKANTECTEFGGITCYKFKDGMQFELPLGTSLRPKKLAKAIKMAAFLANGKLLNQIGM